MTRPDEPHGTGGQGEPTFADVLNSLSLDSGRRRGRRAEPADRQPETRPDDVAETARAGTDADHSADTDEAAEAGEQSPAAVRPYAWTGGRTRPVHELEVETLVSTSEYGRDVAALTSVEHRRVAALCTSPRSVAEVSALLPVPLGVARVVVADMADIGLVEIHRNANPSGQAPDMALMERVLSGLRRL